jgi:hypothetical protein
MEGRITFSKDAQEREKTEGREGGREGGREDGVRVTHLLRLLQRLSGVVETVLNLSHHRVQDLLYLKVGREGGKEGGCQGKRDRGGRRGPRMTQVEARAWEWTTQGLNERPGGTEQTDEGTRRWGKPPLGRKARGQIWREGHFYPEPSSPSLPPAPSSFSLPAPPPFPYSGASPPVTSHPLPASASSAPTAPGRRSCRVVLREGGRVGGR